VWNPQIGRAKCICYTVWHELFYIPVSLNLVMEGASSVHRVALYEEGGAIP
jgi:hypothetical protein